MIGFLGRIPHKLTLIVTGTALASGGAVGLSHSLPDILRGVGVFCYIPDESLFKEPKLVTGNSTTKKQLIGGASYLELEKNEKKKFLNVTEKIASGEIKNFCSNWSKNLR